ncbi:right-handed parallel beta-helix repeat-containing protein [Acanthopleuribacter pedis]|uniref:Right-handed parallel beta-helix repeat-containing protein n=1 Tax=Acanthopleuribacter pedis TaxID=442870 RepID=A0A8J7Q8X1_9BACT|nr:right-handed parallel beta-helix repeat-containing protein [Acanthopleuribacter pedis]MBO1319599.1 right-handed parallel beta-helix repeat-containing protein [Acanthopleuribacter pedis]
MSHHWKLLICFSLLLCATQPILAQNDDAACQPCDLGDVLGLNRSGEWNVYPSIQKALLAVSYEDLQRVIVCPGFYEEVPVMAHFSDLIFEACGAVTIQGLTLKDVSNVVINGFTVDAEGYWQGIGLGFGSSYENDNILIRNCHIMNSGGAGIQLRPWNQQVIIDGCTFTNNVHGVSSILFGGPYLIQNSTFVANSIGAAMSPESRVTFDTNSFYNHEYFGITRGRSWAGVNYSHWITLINNQFEENGGYDVPGTHDANLGNIHLIIDETDQQEGYAP